MTRPQRDLETTSSHHSTSAYGLRLPLRSDLIGQGLRFGLAGGIVALVYLGTTTCLANIFGLPFQAALAIGFCLALAVHFTLQRTFVWASDDFALSLGHQVGRYLIVAGAQYGLTVASTSLLPEILGIPIEIVYLATVGILVSINFMVFRHSVFHPS